MVSINKSKCIGCGQCTQLCPDVFELGSDGKAQAKSQDNVECAKKAANACPASAISA